MEHAPIFAIPTANPKLAGETFAKWQARGYRTAALTDRFAGRPDNCDVWIYTQTAYRGWPWAMNQLLDHCVQHTDALWVIGGGDDMDPDPHAAPGVVARECHEHFGGTFGVMQPTGDRWLEDSAGVAAADRICGSPWIGREFIQRWNGGRGVFSEKFRHFFADELLKCQTEKMGLLWQRKELSHLHHHPSRTGVPAPEYARVNQTYWERDHAAFCEFERDNYGLDAMAAR